MPDRRKWIQCVIIESSDRMNCLERLFVTAAQKLREERVLLPLSRRYNQQIVNQQARNHLHISTISIHLLSVVTIQVSKNNPDINPNNSLWQRRISITIVQYRMLPKIDQTSFCLSSALAAREFPTMSLAAISNPDCRQNYITLRQERAAYMARSIQLPASS